MARKELTKNQVALLTAVITGLSAILVAWIAGYFSSTKKAEPNIIVNPVISPVFNNKLDSPLHTFIPKKEELTEQAPVNKKPTAKISQSNKNGKNELSQNSGTNNGIIGGNGGKIDKREHIVNGNNFGINGDVTVTKEIELQESDKVRILDFIEKFKKDNNTQTECVLVRSTNTTNSSKFPIQLVDFLKTKGYSAKECCYAVYTSPPLRGLDFSMSEGCVTISIGAL